MKKLIVLALLSLMILPVMAQVPTEITKAFPKAKSIKKETKWAVVYDAQKKVLGYAVYSKPASNGIKGYAGETPLLVALNPKERVQKVVLLDNNETPNFLQLVIDSGLLDSWNGMKLKRARKHEVDVVSGATYSSRSIIRSFQAAINTVIN